MESSCKTAHDRKVLWEALLDDQIDVIATDHAPHTLEEKISLT
jgi:dihydroorotase